MMDRRDFIINSYKTIAGVAVTTSAAANLFNPVGTQATKIEQNFTDNYMVLFAIIISLILKEGEEETIKIGKDQKGRYKIYNAGTPELIETPWGNFNLKNIDNVGTPELIIKSNNYTLKFTKTNLIGTPEKVFITKNKIVIDPRDINYIGTPNMIRTKWGKIYSIGTPSIITSKGCIPILSQLSKSQKQCYRASVSRIA